MYAGEAGAIIERIITDTLYAIGYYHTCEAGAIIERIITDTRYAIADYHTREAGAIIKRTVENFSARYGNRLQRRRDIISAIT